MPYDVVGAIVYLTGPPQPATWAMSPDDFAGLGMTITARVPCFREVSALTLFEAMAAGTTSRGLLAWVPLMADSDTPEAVVRWVEVALAEPDDRVRRDVGVFAKAFAPLNPRPDLWLAALEGWQVKNSPYLEEVAFEARSDALSRCKGELIASARTRLGSTIPEDLLGRIEAERDFGRLIRWSISLGRASSFDELRALLDS